MNICNECLKSFSTLFNMKRHRDKGCPVVKERLKKQEVVRTDSEIKDLKATLVEDRDRYELYLIQKDSEIEDLKTTLVDVRGKYEASLKEIDSLKLHIRDLEKDIIYQSEFREKAEKRNEKFEDHLIEQAKKPTFTNTSNQMNINLAAFTITEETAKLHAQKYTKEHFDKGPKATETFVINQLIDEGGRPMILCTDKSRNTFKGLLPNGSIFTDSGGERIVKIISKPTREKIDKIYRETLLELTNDNDGYTTDSSHQEYEILARRHKSHKIILEPARLSKSLAKEFVNGARDLSHFVKRGEH